MGGSCVSSVGGSENLRFYWKEFVNEVDVLVFLVDSADRRRLPCARRELHRLLDKDPDLPVVVVANKQVRGARVPAGAGGGVGPSELGEHPGAGRQHGHARPSQPGTPYPARATPE